MIVQSKTKTLTSQRIIAALQQALKIAKDIT